MCSALPTGIPRRISGIYPMALLRCNHLSFFCFHLVLLSRDVAAHRNGFSVAVCALRHGDTAMRVGRWTVRGGIWPPEIECYGEMRGMGGMGFITKAGPFGLRYPVLLSPSHKSLVLAGDAFTSLDMTGRSTDYL